MIPFGRPPLPQRSTAERVAEDVADLLDRIELDRDYAMSHWRMYRDKQALLDVLATSWHTMDARTLLGLTAAQLAAATVFHHELARFTLWVRHTEAMPATLEARFDLAAARLVPAGRAAMAALGGRPAPAPEAFVPPDWGRITRDESS